MKNYNLLLFMLLLCSWSAQATILTVSNNGGTPAQYTDLQVAHNSANSGDTLFVHASGNNYGNVNISKQLTIIGEGYTGPSFTGLIDISFTNNSASGSSIIGFFISGTIFANGSGLQIDAISIERCYLYYNSYTGSTPPVATPKIYSKGNNWIIRHCIAYETELCFGYGVASGWIIANNILDNRDINYSSIDTRMIDQIINSTVENNVIANVDFIFYYAYNINIKNNIFYQALNIEYNPQVTNSIVNNLSNNAALGNVNGNIQNTNPFFINNYVDARLVNVPALNLQLQASSLARGAGVGGTDMGIHGGATPMPYPYDGKAAKPNIEQLIIQNPVVGQGQFLKFQIEAKTRD